MNRFGHVSMLFVLLGVLSACGGSGPSDRQARDAVAAMFEQSAGTDVREIAQFRKSGCRKASGRDGVNCDVSGTVVMDSGFGRAVEVPLQGNFRFYRHGGQWVASPM